MEKFKQETSQENTNRTGICIFSKHKKNHFLSQGLLVSLENSDLRLFPALSQNHDKFLYRCDGWVLTCITFRNGIAFKLTMRENKLQKRN